MQSSLEGRNWVGKCAQATGMTASLRILSSKADSNTWESFTRSELKLESVHQESPHLDIFRKMATMPLLKQKHRQKHTWRGTEFMLLEVQCEASIVSDDLGCHVICWCWSTVFSEVHRQRSHLPGIFRALHASFCWQALWRCWFHFSAGLGTYPHCQRCQKLVQWPWCYCAWLASKLAWPEPHRESMGYCQEENERHQTQQCRWSKQPGLPLHLSSATGWLSPCHATLMQ